MLAKKFKIPRSVRSWMFANILLDTNLVSEWHIYHLNHPSIKNYFRSANLFLLKKGLRYHFVKNPVKVNMDSLLEYWAS